MMSEQVSVEVAFGQVQNLLKQKKNYAALRQLSAMSLSHSKDIQFLTLMAQTQLALNDLNNLLKTQIEIVRQRGTIEDYIQLMQMYYKLNFRNEALDIGLGLQSKKLTQSEEMQLGKLLVKIYLEENDFEGAQEVIQKMNHQDQDGFMSWAQGVVCLNSDQKDQAIQYFREAVKMNPQNDQAWVSLAMMHKEMGDEDLYLANLEKAIDINPFNTSALKMLTSSVHKKVDKIESAVESVRFYLQEHCFDEEISLCHLQILCQTKQWQAAEFEMEKLILDKPHSEIFKNIKKSMFELQTL